MRPNSKSTKCSLITLQVLQELTFGNLSFRKVSFYLKCNSVIISEVASKTSALRKLYVRCLLRRPRPDVWSGYITRPRSGFRIVTCKGSKFETAGL